MFLLHTFLTLPQILQKSLYGFPSNNNNNLIFLHYFCGRFDLNAYVKPAESQLNHLLCIWKWPCNVWHFYSESMLFGIPRPAIFLLTSADSHSRHTVCLSLRSKDQIQSVFCHQKNFSPSAGIQMPSVHSFQSKCFLNIQKQFARAAV